MPCNISLQVLGRCALPQERLTDLSPRFVGVTAKVLATCGPVEMEHDKAASIEDVCDLIAPTDPTHWLCRKLDVTVNCLMPGGLPAAPSRQNTNVSRVRE